MSRLSKAFVAEEFARRAVQFHATEEPMSIHLWGLFDWADIKDHIKAARIIPNAGFTRANVTIWCSPSREFYEADIAPLIEELKAQR